MDSCYLLWIMGAYEAKCGSHGWGEAQCRIQTELTSDPNPNTGSNTTGYIPQRNQAPTGTVFGERAEGLSTSNVCQC